MRWMATVVIVLGLMLTPADADTLVGDEGTPRQRALVEETVRTFAQAGLELPSTPISFRGPDDCGGNEGLYRPRSGITICAPSRGLEARVLTHELAHAWLETEVTDVRRHAFVALRGLASWDDEAEEWRHRGSEQAAEIITWALLRHPILMVRFPDKKCVELAAGYRLLTEREPVPAASICPVH